MSLERTNKLNSRSFVVTVSYNFNPTKSKYKGTGAGNEEKNRQKTYCEQIKEQYKDTGAGNAEKNRLYVNLMSQ